MAIRVSWGHMEPPFSGKGEVVGGQRWHHSKERWGWVTLGPNLGVFPLEQTRHVGVAKSERPRLTNGGITFEEFQPK